MTDISSPFHRPCPKLDFDGIKIGLASPDLMRSWSFGEVRSPETLSDSTFTPKRDGLLCTAIFGPIKDYECLCGKYIGLAHDGVVCEKCGTALTFAKVRNERMGHIELANPTLFHKSLTRLIALMLDMPLHDVERVVSFESFVVIDPGSTALIRNQLLMEDQQYMDALNEHGDDFIVMIGGEAVHHLLCSLDLNAEILRLKSEIVATDSDARLKHLTDRIMLTHAFLKSDIRPEWMVLTVLPVMPAGLREDIRRDDGRFVNYDMNIFYGRVINRNNRLKRLLEIDDVPDIIVRNEKRILKDQMSALIEKLLATDMPGSSDSASEATDSHAVQIVRRVGGESAIAAVRSTVARLLPRVLKSVLKDSDGNSIINNVDDAKKQAMKAAVHKWVTDNQQLLSPLAMQAYLGSFVLDATESERKIMEERLRHFAHQRGQGEK